ncbi:MAG: bifunctional folylpolyglutamate synthase/dihydrofolate synthase [Saprospiraceae bacterium]|nr:bifunctional folylpolyglutamate synthase/dihydrofolate synthase [Saprospiraceae bacterium]
MTDTPKRTYEETLTYLFYQLPMFQRIGPAAFKKDLGNILALSEDLGNPHQQFRSIHLAGTNGKGSSAHMLAAVLQAAGYKVGLYTSPHYRDFRERIKINGEFISESKVVEFVDRHEEVFKKIQPSFFEITVAMAFVHFAEEEVDVAVVETGLGGRLDSTNILQPELSIITNISFDHQQFLGDTLEKIAGEKAGIIKENTPVVIGETQAQTKVVFEEKAAKCSALIYFADQEIQAKPLRNTISSTCYEIHRRGKLWIEELEVDVRANYQSLNLQTVLQSLLVLQEAKILTWEEAALRKGLKELRNLSRFIGRWQILDRAPLTIADSAHNEGGLKPSLEQLKAIPFAQLHIVFGTVRDKDLAKVLPLLPKSASYYFAKADVPRGMPAEQLKVAAQKEGLAGKAYASVASALAAAKEAAAAEDVIFIGGSIFVVAEVV